MALRTILGNAKTLSEYLAKQVDLLTKHKNRKKEADKYVLTDNSILYINCGRSLPLHENGIFHGRLSMKGKSAASFAAYP